MKRMLAVTALLIACSAFAWGQAPTSNQIEQELRKINSELISAASRGDKSVWDRYLADTYIETEPNGRVITKALLLANLLAPPASMNPTVDLKDVRVREYGDTVVMSYRSEYRAEANGQQISDSSRTTDVWLRPNGRWQLVASHTTHIPAERVAVKVDPKIFDAYVGEYEISPGLVFTVTRDGDKLMGHSSGEKKMTELLPQNETTFFSKGDPELTIFVRNEKGQVTSLIIRSQDGQDLKVKKIK